VKHWKGVETIPLGSRVDIATIRSAEHLEQVKI